MKTTVITFVFLSIFSISFGQSTTCDCKSDLDFLVEKMRDMPSYKHQIKKARKEAAFDTYYETLSAEMKEPISVSECFLKLNKMLNILDDNHAYIIDTNTYLSKEAYKNEAQLSAYLQSNEYTNHPKTTKNLDSLQKSLANKPFDSLEGIYVYDASQTVGVYKKNSDLYEAVVLTTEKPNWERGHLLMSIFATDKGRYDVMRYREIGRGLLYGKNFLHYNGRLWDLRKDTTAVDYSLAPKEHSDWEFQQLNDNTQYLYFGSFSNRTENVEAYERFYDRVKDSLTAPNIIVDLRNNSGGNSKYSDPFVKLLRKSKAKLYVITNSYCGSNGEQMTLNLKELNNTTHVGQVTRGTLAYGINYGRTYTTPSGNFKVLPTDMDFHRKVFEYEETGIVPDITFDFSKDWVDQTLDVINTEMP
ncbi:S41 family peptidase [Luteirhabdus pelagi]|uniref:S41 family peptidase n=1 Tax=Luteirhabdus pelagi TaxID=2792783 RepID=UPI00193967B7|nr:S41 family peptidase [Luteirhabdus pelagi]